jgi:hypothetical protein
MLSEMVRILFLFLTVLTFQVTGQDEFSTRFYPRTLRFDFLFGGNAEEVFVYPVQMKEEPCWAGSRSRLIDTFHYGNSRVRLLDGETGILLFSKGFSTLFQEWQTTAEARELDKSFYQAVFLPFPQKDSRLEIDMRKRDGRFETIYAVEIDPEDYFIVREQPFPYRTVTIQETGKPEESVDLVILAEGYTVEEMDKFLDDARRVTGYLFDEEPFSSGRDRFNVRAVCTPSVDSGTDIPGESIYRNTVFNSGFYTFNEPRYLTTSDMRTVYDAAAVVPWDHIYLLVNSERYGGGGFYNFLNVCTSDNPLTPQVFVHEFGHGFAGLGDEYYTSSVAYEDFYNLEIEPWEPNLTTRVDFDSKWKHMVADSIPVPTPREERFRDLVGVFEGGGYMAKGMYSPVMDCRMKSNDADDFCPVCVEAIKKIIDFHTK